MSRNSRRTQRRAVSIQRNRQKSWLRRYLRALQGGVAAVSIGAMTMLAQPVSAATNDLWIGGGADAKFSTTANWTTTNGGGLPLTSDTLEFGPTSTIGFALTDDLMTQATFSIAGITFDAGASSYTITPNAGTNGFTLTGGITNSSTNLQTINDIIAVTGASTLTTTAGGGNLTLGGAISGAGSLTIAGPGTVTLGGASSYTGGTTVSAGTLNMTGAATGSGVIRVGNTANVNAILKTSGGITTANNIIVGGTAANSIGAVYQTAGTVTSTAAAGTAVFQLGAGTSGYGYYGLSSHSADGIAATLTTTQAGIGSGDATNTGATGVMYVTNGAVYTAGTMQIARGTSQNGVLSVDGAASRVNATAGELYMNAGGGNAVAQLNISNGGLVNTGAQRVVPDEVAAGTGNLTTVNLNSGGTLQTQRFRTFASAGTLSFLNFNGGILMATGSAPLGGLIANTITTTGGGAYVYSGGATIDNAGFNVPLSDQGLVNAASTGLLAPAGQGVTTIAVTDGGSGYIGAPAVNLSGGGTGVGAAAIANMVDDGTGKGTFKIGSITVTSPGQLYTSAPGVTLVGGGAATAATIGTVSTGSNSSGPVTFKGIGTTTLSGTNTYTGATTISGTAAAASILDLEVAAGAVSAGEIKFSSQINVGTGATIGSLIQNSSTAVAVPVVVNNGTITGSGAFTNTVTLTNGSISGSGTFSTVNVADSTGLTTPNTITSKNTGGALVSIGTLAFSGTARINLTTSPTTLSPAALNVTSLMSASGGAGSVTISPTNTAGGWAPGNYQLISHTAPIGGTGFSAFGLSILGVGARQTAVLKDDGVGAPANTIYLQIGGNSAVWSGALGGGSPPANWTTAVQPGPKNWQLSNSPFAQTDYTDNGTIGDAVVFGDTAADGSAIGTGSINISDADVRPAIMSFTNSTVPYTISSTGGFKITGTAPLVMSGTGSLTMNTANTYSGGTTVASGATLNIGVNGLVAGTSAIGTGRLTIGLNTTLNNTSGGAVTFLTNNPQTWNGDWTFTGSNDLNMGTGAVTVNANASQSTFQGGTAVNVVAHTLTAGGAISMPGANNGLIKYGKGTLVLGGGGTIGAPGQNAIWSTTSGQTRVTSGTLKIAGATAGTTLTLGGTRPSLAIGFFGATRNNGNNATADQGSVLMTSGTLTVAEELWMASDTGTYGSFTLQGGTVNEAGILAIARTFNDNGSGGGGVGVLNIGGGAGTATFNVTAGNIAGGSYGTGGAASGARAIMNVLPGGTLTTNNANNPSTNNNGILVGGGSFPGFLNVSGNGVNQAGSGQVTVSVASTGDGLTVGAGGTGAAGGSTANLGAVGGGTAFSGRITTPFVTGGNAANTSFNFHGGTLQESLTLPGGTNGGSFMRSTNDANFRTYIWNEGAVIDTQAFTATISQILRSPSGNGVTAGTLAVDNTLATGYTDMPAVVITNGAGDTTGSGATAVANFNYTTGQITGITITNPGVNYTAVPTFALAGGGGTGAVLTGAATLNAGNVGGILTKIGSGTLALSAANLYTGGTLVSAGILAVNNPTALGTGTLTINGATAALNNTSGAAVVMTNANAQDWITDVGWVGGGALTMTGNVTLDGTGTTGRSINATGSATSSILTLAGAIGNGTQSILNKIGSGTVALSGVSTYTGATNITAGTLQLTGAGSVESSSGIVVNGANAKLVQLSSVPIAAHNVQLTLGTVDGTSTINDVEVADNLGANIASGNGTAVPLTINNLNFQGHGTMNFVLSPATKTQAKLVVGNLNTNVAAANASTPGLVVIKASNTNGFWTFGDVYALLHYTNINNNLVAPPLSAFSTASANFTSMGGRQTATLSLDTVNNILNMTVGGDRVVWTGAGDGPGNWITGPQTNHNWKLSNAGTPTDYLITNGTADAVNFDDSAGAGHTTVNISAATVSPTSMFFNNSAQPYTFTTGSGANAFGIGGIASALINNGGTVIFATPNTYTGGTFMNNGGTLGINNPTAIGTGPLTMVLGGNLDNSSGTDIAMVTAPGGTTAATNTQTWNGDVTYLASTGNALNMGTGLVTIGGAGPTRTVTINGSTLTTGRITVGTAAANLNLVKAGPGTWNTGNGGGGGSTVNGNLTINDGTLRLGAGTAASSMTVTGALNGSSTAVIEDGSTNTAATLTETNNSSATFDGILRDGAGSNGGGRLALVKNGTGTLTLSNNNTFSNGVTVNGGQLLLTGSIQPSATPVGNFGILNVGTNLINNTPTNAIVTLPNTTLNAPKTGAPAVQIGGANNTAGALRINDDQFHGIAAGSELWLGTGDGGYGVMDMTGGAVSVNSWFALGRGGGQGVLNLSGGTITMPNTNNGSGALTNGSFGGSTANGVVHGLVNITGGTFIANGDAGGAAQTTTAPFFAGDRGSVFAGEGANAVMDISGTGLLQVGGASATLRLARQASTGIVNLLPGGTILTTHVTQGAGTGIFNFNGGTLKAYGLDSATNPFFGITNYHQGDPQWNGAVQGTLGVYVYGAGGTIDSNGGQFFMTAPILDNTTGSGVSLAGITVSGSGFIGTPVVQIARGAGDTTGAGASALAIIDSNGNLTGLQLTSPGTGYTAPPVVTLAGGGLGNTGQLNGAASATAMTVPNASGPITFADSVGGGIMQFGAVNTTKGPIVVQSGQLDLLVNGALASSSRLVMAGGTLRTESTGSIQDMSANTKLDVTAESHLLLAAETYKFADSSTIHWTNPNSLYNPGNNAVLHIDNYNGSTTKIQFPTATSLTPNELAQVTFNGSDHGALVPDGAVFDLVPSTAALPLLLKNGDVDHNNTVDAGDIGRALAAVTDVTAYQNTYLPSTQGGVPSGYTLASEAYTLADVGGGTSNGAGDGAINNLDLQALIVYLANGGTGSNAPGGGSLTAVPEPGTCVLMVIGGALIAGGSVYRRRRNANQPEASGETGTTLG